MTRAQICPTRTAVGFAMGLILAAASAAAPLPDWVGTALAAKNSAKGVATMTSVVRNGGEAVELLSSTFVQFTSTDQAQTRHRVVIWVAAVGSRSRLPTARSYDANTERVVSARAWTVSADGKRVRSFRQGSFVDTVAQYNDFFWNAERTIRFDASDKVETGGIVACEFEIITAPGALGTTCEFESSDYVLNAQFEAAPAPVTRLLWHASSPRLAIPAAGATAGSLRWDISHLAPYGQGRPNGFLANPLAVAVRCVPAGPSPVFARNWEDQSRLAAGVMDPSRAEDASIRDQAARLTAGKTDRWNKVRAIAEFVQRQIVYLSVTLDKDNLAGFRPHRAAQVLRDRYGDCKDKATLLVTLLQAEGIDARVVLLYNGNPSVVAADWPSLYFNHAIVAVPAGSGSPVGWPVVETSHFGPMVFFDPTDPVTPLGVLTPTDQSGYGLIVDAKAGELVRLPTADPGSSHLQRTIHAHFRANGIVEADVDEDRQGLAASQAYAVRFMQGSRNFTRTLEARVHQATPLAENLKWTEIWDAAAARYRLSLHFQAGDFIRPLDEGTEMISPQFLPVGETLVPWTSKREGVVWLPASAITEETSLPIPDGYRVEEMPDSWAQQGNMATGRVSYRAEGKTVIYRTELSRPGGFLDKSRYDELRTFYLKLHEAQRRPIVFRRIPPS